MIIISFFAISIPCTSLGPFTRTNKLRHKLMEPYKQASVLKAVRMSNSGLVHRVLGTLALLHRHFYRHLETKIINFIYKRLTET